MAKKKLSKEEKLEIEKSRKKKATKGKTKKNKLKKMKKKSSKEKSKKVKTPKGKGGTVKGGYVKSLSEGVKYPVLPDIGELILPFVGDFDEARFTFGDRDPQKFLLGTRHKLADPLPRIPKRGSTLKVVSELVGAGVSEINYYFYELMDGEDCYTFYRSTDPDGKDAEECGTVNSIVSSLDNTTLNGRGANDGGSPIIIIGTINIDPTVILQQSN